MYAVSENYISAIRARTRMHRLVGTITLTDGTEVPLSRENIEADSVEIEKSCSTGEELQFGNVILTELRLCVRTKLNRYLFFEADVVLNYELQLADGSWETVPLGVYKIGEVERNKDIVSIIAYDRLIALDDDYGGKALYGTPYEILLAVCEEKGMELANTEDEINALPNADQLIQVDETSGCDSWRDCVKVICQMTGTFAVADREGKLLICQYHKEVDAELQKSDRFVLTASDFEVNYIGIIIESSTAKYMAYDQDTETGLEMIMRNAPAWDYGLEETLQARTETLLQELLKIRYTPCEMSAVSDPRFDCGDRIALLLDDGTVIESLITKITWKFGTMDVVSTGRNPKLYGMTPKKAAVIRQLQTQNTENKLIFYSFTNQNAVTAKSGGEEQLVAQVTCATTKATSAMFIAQLPVEVECEDTEEIQTTTNETETTYAVRAMDSGGASTTITDAEGNPVTLSVTVKNTDTDTVKTVTQGYVDLQVEYYIDGNLVDYELVHRCRAGRHILALLYIFDSLDGNCSFLWQVRVKVVGGSGTVTVPKRGFRATITGQGMAGTDKWDGTLTVEELTPRFGTNFAGGIAAFTEDVAAATDEPTASAITETTARFAARFRTAFVGNITEEITAQPVVEHQTIKPTTEAVLEWTFKERYVDMGENGLQLKTVWNYESAEQAIDSGRMTAVKAMTNDLASVEEVTVSG